MKITLNVGESSRKIVVQELKNSNYSLSKQVKELQKQLTTLQKAKEERNRANEEIESLRVEHADLSVTLETLEGQVVKLAKELV